METQMAGWLSTAAFLVALNLTPASAQGGPDNGGPPAGPQAGGASEAGGGATSPRGGPGQQAQEPGPSQGIAPGKEEKGKSVEKPNEPTEKDTEKASKPEGKPEEKSTGKPEEKSTGKPEEKSTEQREKPAEKTGQPEGKTSETPTGAPKESVEKPGMEKSTEGKTGEAAADREGARTKLEPQQVQKVKTYFTAHKPDVKRIERSAVSVSIGIAVPASIALYALPADVVVVIGDCPLEYFIWGHDIVLVDSCSREVVEILVGAA